MRIIARRTNATTVLAERSKSRAKWRLRLIHALGKASKPAAAALRRHQNGAARLRVSGIWISPAEIEDVLAGIRLDQRNCGRVGRKQNRARGLRVWFSRRISREFLYEHSLTVRSFDRVATLGDSVT